MPGTVSEVSATSVAEDHAASVSRGLTPLEHPVLLGGRQPAIQRQHLEPFPARQEVGGVTNLTLAGQEDQDVARSLAGQLVHRVEDGLALVPVLAALETGFTGR